jgi:fatty acid-binding protein DegV
VKPVFILVFLRKCQVLIKLVDHLFMLANLKALQKGGRISKTKYLLGNVLQIKPVLDVEAGKIEVIEKVPGSKKAINIMTELFKEKKL